MTTTRAGILRAFTRALRELDPASRVADAVPRSLRSTSSPPVHVVAIGKAAPAMAAGAIERLDGAVARCLVVTSDGTDVAELTAAAERNGLGSRVDVMRAGHPLPDARSVRAGNACLAAIGARTLVLVSGGASALACAPSAGITLGTKRAITRTMLASGASIQDINVVRKHLSRIKGGGLARLAPPGSLFTIVASDVIGGTPSDVGSGPSVPDESTVASARRLLARFAPAFAGVPLVRTLAPSAKPRSRATIAISPEELARAMAVLLGRPGAPRVRVLPSAQTSVEELAAEYVTLAERTRRPQVFVRAAEPAIEVTAARSRGRGGRSTHLAALVGQRFAAQRSSGATKRVLFAALASDGVDGSSRTGGAIIDGTFGARVAETLGATALARSLERFDTAALHHALHTAVPMRPTGHNLADVHVLVVA